MKKIVIFLVLLSTVVIAQSRVEYSISLVGMSMDYKEYDNAGVLLDSEESVYSDITGVEFAYSYFLDRRSEIDLKIMSLSGTTKYVGSYLDSDDEYGSVVSTTVDDIKDIYFGYSAKNRYDQNINLLANIGLGYRYWQRALSTVQIEEYEWYSLRAGIGVEYNYQDFSIAFLGEYQYGINPTMTATGMPEEFKLDAADIIELSIPLRYEVNSMFALSASYVFTRQEIKESNLVIGNNGKPYVEPDSTAYNQYLKVGIIFKY
jgi:hypothetical protein